MNWKNCPHCGEQLEFTLEERLAKMEAFHKEILKDPDKCKEFLMATGAYNDDKTLKEEWK